MRAVTLDWTMLSSTAARFMLRAGQRLPEREDRRICDDCPHHARPSALGDIVGHREALSNPSLRTGHPMTTIATPGAPAPRRVLETPAHGSTRAIG